MITVHHRTISRIRLLWHQPGVESIDQCNLGCTGTTISTPLQCAHTNFWTDWHFVPDNTNSSQLCTC
jgi:hypothetical protein